MRPARSAALNPDAATVRSGAFSCGEIAPGGSHKGRDEIRGDCGVNPDSTIPTAHGSCAGRHRCCANINSVRTELTDQRIQGIAGE